MEVFNAHRSLVHQRLATDVEKAAVRCVRRNDADGLRDLWPLLTEVYITDNRGVHWWHLAAQANAVEVLDVLHERAANMMTWPCNRGNTALVSALEAQKSAALERLLSFGMSANGWHHRSPLPPETLLNMAVGTNEPALVDTLLNAGADVNARNEQGRTALLMVAALAPNIHGHYRDPQALQALTLGLLNAGSDPTVVDAQGQGFHDLVQAPKPIGSSLKNDERRSAFENGRDPRRQAFEAWVLNRRASPVPRLESPIVRSRL